MALNASSFVRLAGNASVHDKDGKQFPESEPSSEREKVDARGCVHYCVRARVCVLATVCMTTKVILLNNAVHDHNR